MTYNVTAAPTYDANMQPIIVYKLRRHVSAAEGAGRAAIIFSVQHWPTRQEAQAIADAANAGEVIGLQLASYEDD